MKQKPNSMMQSNMSLTSLNAMSLRNNHVGMVNSPSITDKKKEQKLHNLVSPSCSRKLDFNMNFSSAKLK